MSDWRYILTRLYGDGDEEIIADNIPLLSPSIVLPVSGAERVEGSVGWEVARLRKAGEPLFQSWNTAIYAERSGVIRAGAIVVDVADDGGGDLELETVGFAGYPVGMPYLAEKEFVHTDVFDIVRHVWQHLSAQPGANLGVRLPSLKSGVEIGEPAKNVEFSTGAGEAVAFEAGPYKLNFWSNDDLGRVIDDLASSTPFEYRVQCRKSGESFIKELSLGAPRLGARRSNLRFVVGENVLQNPEITQDGDVYATNILVLGAGEGRVMNRAEEHVPGSARRVRRTEVLSDKSIKSNKMASAVARTVARRHVSNKLFDSITVRNHSQAPLGSYNPGDEILIQTAPGWYDSQATWVRITSMTIDPSDDSVELDVIRADRA